LPSYSRQVTSMELGRVRGSQNISCVDSTSRMPMDWTAL
jgi:hypothetical protein